MSKSKKNVISPDDVIDRHGADAMRLYEMFMGDFEAEKPWDTRTVEGVVRFLQKVWRLLDAPRVSKEKNERIRHRTIHAVTDRLDNFKFNTAIAALMEFLNALSMGAAEEDVWTLVTLLSPFAPHLAEEMGERLGGKGFVSSLPWPKADPALVVENTVEYPVQINGKLKDRLSVPVGTGPEAVLSAAKALPRVQEALNGHTLVKEIHVPGRMVNFVVASQKGRDSN